jgi:hypothetical protein
MVNPNLQEEFIDSGEMRGRLQRLDELFPGQAPEVYAFARVLSGYLYERLLPRGFSMCVGNLFQDIDSCFERSKSKNASPADLALLECPTGNQIQNIRRSLPDLVRAICPEKFGEIVIADLQQSPPSTSGELVVDILLLPQLEE